MFAQNRNVNCHNKDANSSQTRYCWRWRGTWTPHLIFRLHEFSLLLITGRKDVHVDGLFAKRIPHQIRADSVRYIRCKCSGEQITNCRGEHLQAKSGLFVLMLQQQQQLSLWDTAGQEEYDRLRPLSYASASVFILCFAMCNRASYLNVASKWHPELKHFCPLTPIVLVGSRADEVTDELHLAHMRKQGHTPVTTAEGLEMAKRIGATEYLEVSAKTGANLKEAFDTAIRTTLMPPKKHHHCMLL
jgi:Rho family protein